MYNRLALGLKDYSSRSSQIEDIFFKSVQVLMPRKFQRKVYFAQWKKTGTEKYVFQAFQSLPHSAGVSHLMGCFEQMKDRNVRLGLPAP